MIKNKKEDFIKIWEGFYRIGVYKGLSKEDAEDYASFCVEKRLTGRKATADQLYKDYMRKKFGDTRGKKGKLRSEATLFQKELNDSNLSDKNAPEETLDYSLTLFYHADKLGLLERIIFLLKFYFVLHNNEISLLFNVTESRISQVLSRIKARVTKNAKSNSSNISH